MHLLQPKPKHRAIDLLEDIPPDFDDKIWSDSEDVLIERRMVQLAKGNAVSNDRLTVWIGIWGDMRRLKQGHMPKPAQRTLLPVYSQYPLPEQSLMQPNLYC